MAKYRLELVERRKWGGFNKFPNCGTTLVVNMSRTGRYSLDIPREDIERLAKATGMEIESLLPPTNDDPKDKVGGYWKNFAVRVTQKGINIDTSQPFEELLYLFCKSHKFVADGPEQVTTYHTCVLTNIEEAAVIKNERNRKRREALMQLNSMNISEMRKALRILGLSNRGDSDDVVEATLHDRVEKDPERFLNLWTRNKDRQFMLMINQGIDLNIFRKNRQIYYYGTIVMGHSMDEAIAWLKEPGNREVREVIELEINKKGTIA